MKRIRKVLYFFSNLGDFAPWREEFSNPSEILRDLRVLLRKEERYGC